jgi:hypothetical protein
MLRDGYPPMHVFALGPALCLALAPVRAQLEHLRADAPLCQAVKADLAHRRPRPLRDGRPSPPVEVLLRMLVVTPLYDWSAEATERWGSARLVLRQCCRVSVAPVPDDPTRRRWAHWRQPATLPRLRDHVVALARARQVTRGRPRRIEGTVGATNIPHLTESTLRSDGGRILRRTLGTATHRGHEATILARAAWRDRRRSATRQRTRLMEAARQRGTAAADRMPTASPRLLDSPRTTVPHAQQVGAGLPAPAPPTSQTLRATLDRVVPLLPHVIAQTPRRVSQGAAGPAVENVGSLFEPHTAIIRTGTPGQPTACGRVRWWDAVAGGIISRDAMLEGPPAEEAPWPPRLDPHRQVGPPRACAVCHHARHQAGGVAQAGGNIGQAPCAGAATVVPAGPQLAGGQRGPEQWLETPPDTGPVSLSWHRREGTLGRLGRDPPQSAGHGPGDGDRTHKSGPKDGGRLYIGSDIE